MTHSARSFWPVADKTPEPGIPGPCPGETAALKRAHRNTEDSCRLLLVKQRVQASSAAIEFVGRINTELKFAGKVLPNLQTKIPAKSSLALVSRLQTEGAELFGLQDWPNERVSAGARKLGHEQLLRLGLVGWRAWLLIQLSCGVPDISF